MSARIPKGFRTLTDVRNELGADAFKSGLNLGQFEIYRLDERSGSVFPVPASQWSGMHSLTWIANGEFRGPIWAGGPNVQQKLLVKEPRHSSEITAPPVKNKGGNPGKWDWEGALIEAATSIYVNGIPDRTDLKKHILNWFSDNSIDGSTPDDGEVRKRINRLCDAIEQGLSSEGN